MSKLLEKAKEFWDKGRSFITPDGAEIPDPRSLELPVGFERPESIQETIRRLVTDPAIREQLQVDNVETFDEADDFEIDDDVPLVSPHEEQFDPHFLLSREQEIMAGTVKPRSREELEAAAAVIAQHAKKPPVVEKAEKP